MKASIVSPSVSFTKVLLVNPVTISVAKLDCGSLKDTKRSIHTDNAHFDTITEVVCEKLHGLQKHQLFVFKEKYYVYKYM